MYCEEEMPEKGTCLCAGPAGQRHWPLCLPPSEGSIYLAPTLLDASFSQQSYDNGIVPIL